MFRTIGDRPSAWELLLPPEVLRLPEELARVDAVLDVGRSAFSGQRN
jgi:IS5 family transposase